MSRLSTPAGPVRGRCGFSAIEGYRVRSLLETDWENQTKAHLPLVLSQHTSLDKTFGVRLRASDVCAIHAPVVAERLVEALHHWIHRACEAASPELGHGETVDAVVMMLI